MGWGGLWVGGWQQAGPEGGWVHLQGGGNMSTGIAVALPPAASTHPSWTWVLGREKQAWVLDAGAARGCWTRVLDVGAGRGCWRGRWTQVLGVGAGRGCWMQVLGAGAGVGAWKGSVGRTACAPLRLPQRGAARRPGGHPPTCQPRVQAVQVDLPLGRPHGVQQGWHLEPARLEQSARGIQSGKQGGALLAGERQGEDAARVGGCKCRPREGPGPSRPAACTFAGHVRTCSQALHPSGSGPQ